MASGEHGKLSTSEVSTIRETGRIPEGYTDEIQVEVDGEFRLYFVNPDKVAAAIEGKAGAVVVLDANGLERGIPLEWTTG